ncbi:MAG: response regulator [Planctomycetes bacterium]|nr:response regulator [Planctomycetota bacterium]
MSCRVLVAEPDRDVRASFAEAIADAGGIVYPAGSLREGLEVLDRSVVEASVIDEVLPDGSGFDLLDALRSRLQRDIPCVLTTARPSKEVRLRALSMGVVTVWPLPYPREQVVISFQRIVIRYVRPFVVLAATWPAVG